MHWKSLQGNITIRIRKYGLHFRKLRLTTKKSLLNFGANPPNCRKWKKCSHSLVTVLKQNVSLNFDYEYDQLVAFGELLSTQIISLYFNKIGLKNKWG